jgi:dTDP-glucose 4,6-dehydratase
VTGGAGFIGSHFIDFLLAAHPDYRVIILDKLTYAGNKEVNLSNALSRAPDRLEFFQGDVRNLELDRWVLQTYHCEAIVHLAAETFVEQSTKEPTLFRESNADGSAQLLEAARLEGGIQRFILVSTVEVYGTHAREDALWHEADLIKPPTPYAAAKAAAEHWAFAYWKSYGLPTVITRSCNNHGPRQHTEKQLPAFITAALQGAPLRVHGDGEHLRQWLYVEDHCRALDLILHADEQLVAGEIFNIGGGPHAERTTLQNAYAVLERLGKRAEITFVPDRVPSIRRLALDSSKLEQRLGWKPLVSFEEGLERTLAFYAGEQLAHPAAFASERAPLLTHV